jgi:hypothetical protein
MPEAIVHTPLAMYEAALQTITDVCADPWFAEQMELSQRGDELAWRRISCSCLRLVLEIAKRKQHPDSSWSVLRLAEEGNMVLVRTIKQYTGTTAEDFLRELTRQVEHRLTMLVEHPGMLDVP